MKKALFILFLLTISVQPAYADSCEEGSNGVFINGTPQPSLQHCPESFRTIQTNSGTEVTVHTNTQPAPTQPPTIVTVVVTATPMATPSIAVYHVYKPIYYAAKYTPTPTLSPTATPSATKAPTPTKKPDVKPTQQKFNLFQAIAHFFQNILSIFKKL